MCLCYINQEIGTETDETKKESSDGKQEYSSNFVAVGCLKGAIQIWDLDVLGKIYFPTLGIKWTLDAPGPAYTLIGHERSSMVISLSWDGNSYLASGGADGKCLVWSLEDGSKVCLGKETNSSPLNQVLFLKDHMLATGDGNGIFNIYKKER